MLNISLPATNSQTISLKQFQSQFIVLYFYPRDNTPGCTQEGQDFRDHFTQFKKLNAVILGVSTDSVKKHENFKAKYDFPFELLADTEETLSQAFDVIKEKKLYGKTFMGIERSTFLLDPTGGIIHEWLKVKVPGHVKEVLTTLKSLSK